MLTPSPPRTTPYVGSRSSGRPATVKHGFKEGLDPSQTSNSGTLQSSGGILTDQSKGCTRASPVGLVHIEKMPLVDQGLEVTPLISERDVRLGSNTVQHDPT